MNLKQAGKEVLKGNFGNAFTEIVRTNSYRNNGLRPPSNIPIDIIIGGGDGVGAFFSWGGINSSLLAYDLCPPLKSVCNRRALATSNGVLSVVNSLGKPSQSAQSKKALTLLANPNPLQSWVTFISQIRIYLDLVGYCVIIPMRPVGYDYVDSEKLWIVPPTLCNLVTTGSRLNLQSGGLDYVAIGGAAVNPSDVIIIQDVDPSVTSMVIPASKIKSLEHPINNIIGAFQSESTLIKQRGPSGIITGEVNPQLGAPVPLLAEEKERLQMEFNKSYGYLAGQSPMIITNAALRYQKTGFDAIELRLHEAIRENTKFICDTIGYPSELLSVTDSKYDNMEQADKNLYTKFIIPGSKNIMQQLGYYLLPKTDSFLMDYSHLPELQADNLKKAEADRFNAIAYEIMFKNNLVTQNEWRKAMGMEEVPSGNIYFSSIKDLINVAPTKQPIVNDNNINTNGSI